jgi:hypothetical protein
MRTLSLVHDALAFVEEYFEAQKMEKAEAVGSGDASKAGGR